ncbi:hypothetical protein WG936_08055 [Corynebacterium sp. H127]|uniref:hypothetical protein n=1 Tax=Corynebacterium sp. H127 TaxID=3133418 RepID=UPI0030B2E784
MANRLPARPSYGDIFELFGADDGSATKKLVRESMQARDRVSDAPDDLSQMFTELVGYTRDIALHASAAIAELEARIVELEARCNG